MSPTSTLPRELSGPARCIYPFPPRTPGILILRLSDESVRSRQSPGLLADIDLAVTFIDSKGRRVTTESAYLTPEVLARPNLTVATHAQVTRVLLDTSEGGKPRAVGVQFKDRQGELYEVRARKEVVVS